VSALIRAHTRVRPYNSIPLGYDRSLGTRCEGGTGSTGILPVRHRRDTPVLPN
jgi:hypothetical protein